MKKLVKTANILEKLCKVGSILMAVAGVGLTIAMVFMTGLYLSGESIDFITTLDFGPVVFQPSEAYVLTNQTDFTLSMLTLALVVVGVVVAWFFFKTTRQILKPIAQNQPFHPSISGNLKKLGWLQIFGGIATGLIELVEFITIACCYDLPGLFLSDKIVSMECNYVIDLNFLFTAMICFLASYIFRYGTELQQLSDETL